MAKKIVVDGCSAAAEIAFACSDASFIYPITPSSPMGEWCDEAAAKHKPNIWGSVPTVVEMESEGGAAGAVHGSLATGSLTTTFTASQGLLLMIPNMYKIAGELTPSVFHVSARSLACQGLCIFGDHGDVMACRQTGFAMLCSNSVQEAHDMALVAHASTLEAKVPFLHFFDGFRTSHEVQKIDEIDYDTIRKMINDDFVADFRRRALNPEHPTMRGTAQNPDINFQGREACNKYYEATPAIVQKYMDQLGELTGRKYRLYDYVGAADAEYVVVAMGSGCDTLHETVDALVKEGKKVGLLKVHLYRPFSMVDFVKALPATVKVVTVLDRTKEPGANDPLYLDVAAAIGQGIQEGVVSFKYPKILAGRYGIGSKDFTPQMCANVFANMTKEKPLDRFVVGIVDDVSGRYILGDDSFVVPTGDRKECMFWGLGADGTVGANKNSIKIIGNYTENFAQGYFEYDSKKSGGVTISHLRFGSDMIRSPYFINSADFTACHCFPYLEKYDMLKAAKPGSTFLLASPYSAAEIWNHMPDEVEQAIIDKKLKFYVINAAKIALETGMGTRTNTVLQTAFFHLSGIKLTKADGTELDPIAVLKEYAEKAYAKKGMDVVEKNWKCIDAAVAAIEKVDYPAQVAGALKQPPAVADEAPEFIKSVTAKMIAQKGNDLPVSAIPEDGTWPTATTQWEKRNVAAFIPEWDPAVCIQCGQCSLICPHAAIRLKAYKASELEGAPATFKSADAKTPKMKKLGEKFTVQVAPEDCMGCTLCVVKCPMSQAKKDAEGKTVANPKPALKMVPQIPLRKSEAENWKFFLSLPEVDEKMLDTKQVLDSQLKRPLFEFSGACSGCGETPYVKLLTQLVGDRLLVANATGCSSIYGGNLPTTPYCQRKDGRGPAWANSLFEDNAEFGLGMRVSADKLQAYAFEIVDKMLANPNAPENIKAILTKIKEIDQFAPNGVEDMRAAVAELKAALKAHECDCPARKNLLALADDLVRKSVWIIGGDGWAYDIGYGGLDHVLASGRNVKILVLDTEVYSNTGGQASKSTPLGAIAKFAASGKPSMKKNLALMQMQYKNIYIAQVSMGANPSATVKAFNEAEAYNGPALIIGYAHCIEQGLNTAKGPERQQIAVNSAHFPLFRYNPDLTAQGKNPLQLDSKPATVSFAETAAGENRFKQLFKANPDGAQAMLEKAEAGFKANYAHLQQLAALPPEE